MEEKQKQTILDIPKVIAVGISAPVATILTSRFGVAGTLIGLALSAVILTALADMLKVYLARAPATVAKVPDAVAKMPGGLRARLSWHNVRSRLGAAFARFSSLSPAPARRLVHHDRQRRSSGDLVPCGANSRYRSRAGCGPKPFLLGVARVSYRVFYRRWW